MKEKEKKEENEDEEVNMQEIGKRKKRTIEKGKIGKVLKM